MNRIKKILAALAEIGIDPPAQAIRDAWADIKSASAFSEDDDRGRNIKLIGKVIEAVAGIADDLAKRDKQ